MRSAALAALIFAVTSAARADGGHEGDESALPPPLPAEGCVPPAAQRLSYAATAYKYLVAAHAGPSAAKAVHGVHFNDSARAIAWVERSLGQKPPAEWQRAVDAGCTKVLCALQKTFGDLESALWFLVASAEVDAPPSLDQTPYDVPSVWEQHELRALAHALLEAPPELKKVQTLRAFRRLPSGQGLKKGTFYNAVSYQKDADLHGLGTIVIRDTVWKFPQRDVRAVVTHELGHHWEMSRSLETHKPHPSLQDGWLKLSGWRSKNGGHEAHDFELVPGAQIATAGETLPGEDFADTVANFRYLPRLVKAYSKPKYELLHKFYGREFLKPEANPALEAAWASIGGPLKSIRECAGYIQRATFGGKLHQHELYAVIPKGKGTHWEPIARSSFVVRSGCIDRALEKLEATEKWTDVSCRQDPEDLAVAVADRLEDAWAAFDEAAQAIQAAVPADTAAGCLAKKDVTQHCFAGEHGAEAATKEASRLLEEYGGDMGDAPALAAQLITQTPLAPSDDELRGRFPVFKSPEDLLFACLKGALEIQQRPEKGATWTFWVKLPPSNEKRGFKDPIWNPACGRDFAEHLSLVGLKVDEGDKLFDHLAYLLKNQTGPLLHQFTEHVLDGAPALLTACKTHGGPCAAKWLKPRLAGIAPDALVDQLAGRLAGTLTPAPH